MKNNGSETLMSHENENEKNKRVCENCLEKKERRHKRNQQLKEF